MRAPDDHLPLGPGGEFDAIRALVARWGASAKGIGDDGALLHLPAGRTLVASTDTSLEHVHFEAEWLTPEEIGWRATMAALSDLAAMAAEPLGVLVALGVPERWRPALGELAQGIEHACVFAGAAIVGGDTTRAAELTVGITVLGSTVHPLRRRGARVGDAIYVTGTFGGPLHALRAFEAGEEPPPVERERFARPVARIREAIWLASHGARAGLDVSDGLAQDLGHLAAASGVAIELEVARVPRLSGVSAEHAVASGEEYELVVAAAPGMDTEAFQLRFGLALTEVGRVVEGSPGVRPLLDGRPVEPDRGHDHFAAEG